MTPVTYPLDEIWPRVMPAICRLHRRWIRHLKWTPIDVLDALRDRRAFLFCSSDDDSFAVVRSTAPDTLFIWIACGINGKRDQNLALLKEIARNIGASWLEMESSREGFKRLPGWQRLPGDGMSRYRLEV